MDVQKFNVGLEIGYFICLTLEEQTLKLFCVIQTKL